MAKTIRDGQIKLEIQCLNRYFYSNSGSSSQPYIIVQQWPCNMYAAAARWSLDVFFSAMGGGQVVRMIRPEWLVIQATDILPMMYWRIAQLTRLLATCNVVDLSHRAKCC